MRKRPANNLEPRECVQPSATYSSGIHVSTDQAAKGLRSWCEDATRATLPTWYEVCFPASMTMSWQRWKHDRHCGCCPVTSTHFAAAPLWQIDRYASCWGPESHSLITSTGCNHSAGLPAESWITRGKVVLSCSKVTSGRSWGEAKELIAAR